MLNLFNQGGMPPFAPKKQQVIDPRAEYERQSKLVEIISQIASQPNRGGIAGALAMAIDGYTMNKASKKAEGSLAEAIKLEEQQAQEALAREQQEAEAARAQAWEDFQRQERFKAENATEPSDIRAFRAAGIDPASPEARAALLQGKGTSVNVNTGQQGPRIGTIPPGYEAITDPVTGRTRFYPIEGGPVEAEQADAEQRAGLRQERTAVTRGVMQDEISRALEVVENNPNLAAGPLSPVGQFLNIGPANRLNSALEGLKPNIAFERLDQMRQSSPTGGAVGQLTDKEREALASVFGSLRQSQHPEDLQYNLRRLNNLLIDAEHGTPQQRAGLVRDGQIPEDLNAQIESLYMPLENQKQTDARPNDTQSEFERRRARYMQ